jgi:hypothetical protein
MDGRDGAAVTGVWQLQQVDVQLIGFQRYGQSVLDPLRSSLTGLTEPNWAHIGRELHHSDDLVERGAEPLRRPLVFAAGFQLP